MRIFLITQNINGIDGAHFVEAVVVALDADKAMLFLLNDLDRFAHGIEQFNVCCEEVGIAKESRERVVLVSTK